MKRAVLFTIKPGKEQIWRDWCNQINSKYHADALATLEEEGLVQEMSLIFHIDGTAYMIGYVDGEAKASNTEREINKIHNSKKQECLEYLGNADVLYSLLTNS